MRIILQSTDHLTDKNRAEMGRVGSKKREKEPASHFLDRKNRKYPFYLNGKPSFKGLRAAYKRANIEGDHAMAAKAKRMIHRMFPGKHFGE